METIVTKPRTEIPTPAPNPQPWTWFLILLAVAGMIGVVAHWKDADFLEKDEKGKPVLSKKRKEKLDKALKELDEAEQYALLANKNGYYPCYNCGDTLEIFLHAKEVWRYGSTVKREKGRYGNSLEGKNLFYFVQYEGTLQECLRQELLKIFNYPTLPENLKRAKPLMRPPGNKVDR